jgi:hypothetical protein
MGPLARFSRLAWAAVVGVLGIALVGTAVVLAQSGEPASESGPPSEVRYANPPRTSPPRIVGRGSTDAGQTYILRTSQAGRLLCLEVEYQRPEQDLDAEGHQGAVASLMTSEVCVDPAEHSVAASMGELFVDPTTGEVSKQPQRFVYGVVTDEASRVVLRSPAAATRDLELSPVPFSDVKVFAGSAPRDAVPGQGAVVAKGHDGEDLGEHRLAFVGPGH